MEFHGWKIFNLNGYWNCKHLNCNYPIQSFMYIIDALIYCKAHPIEKPSKDKIEGVLELMRTARQIRKSRV